MQPLLGPLPASLLHFSGPCDSWGPHRRSEVLTCTAWRIVCLNSITAPTHEEAAVGGSNLPVHPVHYLWGYSGVLKQ
jgi:hypothetical protein